MWSNVHTHSQFCDGKGSLAEHVAQAREQQMISLGFSSHAPLPFPCKWCMKTENFSAYRDEIDQIKSAGAGIEVYAGLEVDFVPGLVGPSDFSALLDYTIGSIHFVEALPDGTHWEIDGPHALFLEGYEKIFHNNIRDTLVRYYELTRQMINDACPTVVGHLDKIKIQNVDGQFFNEQDPWYVDQVKQTLDLIKKRGAIVEVNTRGLYHKKLTDPYPSPWILRLLLEKNIPITINSDAHRPEDLTNQFPETATLLHSIGFKTITCLHEGRWKPFSFNTHGVVY
jgi:histidinol-phosphatase (PHP family)